MAWQQYFKVTGVRPGRIVTYRHGELDFRRDNIPVDVIRDLYEHDFPYLRITAKGKEELYMDVTAKEVVEYVNSAESSQEILRWLKVKPDSVTVKRAASKRLDELNKIE